MPLFAALLRGINVGANKRMKMEALRKVFVELGHVAVKTYLQSGNVVFRSAASDRGKLARGIEAGIEKAFGFHSDVILRSASELRQAIASNPFAGRPDLDAAKLLVIFLDGRLPAAEAKALRELDAAPDEIWPLASEIFIYYPDGMGRSKLDRSMGKVLKTNGTARNWRTTNALLAMIETAEEQ